MERIGWQVICWGTDQIEDEFLEMGFLEMGSPNEEVVLEEADSQKWNQVSKYNSRN